MAIIKPFKALRYNSKTFNDMSDLICPPYDVINNIEREIYLNKNPYNFIRIEFPKIKNSYDEVKNTFNTYKKNNILIKDKNDSLYLYEMNFKFENKNIKLKGLVCLVKIEDLKSGNIVLHENTFKKAKDNRFSLLKAINCDTSPLYFLFDGRNNNIFEKINFKKQELISNVNFQEVTHNLYRISDIKKINEIIEYFKNKKLFIADGHHRYETALNYKYYCNNFLNHKSEYVMVLLVDFFSEALKLLPTHRILKFCDDVDFKKITEVFSKNFLIEKRYDVKEIENILNKQTLKGKRTLGFYAGKDFWLLLNFKKIFEKLDSYCETQILNDFILNKFFKNNLISEIFYERNFDEIYKLVNKEKTLASFVIPKMSKKNLFNIFLKGIKLPQKTTYFYPKPVSGLIMHEIDF